MDSAAEQMSSNSEEYPEETSNSGPIIKEEKLTESERERIILRTIRSDDPSINKILISISMCEVFSLEEGKWEKYDLEGSFYIISGENPRTYYRMLILGQKSVKSIVEDIEKDMIFEKQDNPTIIMYKSKGEGIKGIFFEEEVEGIRVYNCIKDIQQLKLGADEHIQHSEHINRENNIYMDSSNTHTIDINTNIETHRDITTNIEEMLLQPINLINYYSPRFEGPNNNNIERIINGEENKLSEECKEGGEGDTQKVDINSVPSTTMATHQPASVPVVEDTDTIMQPILTEIFEHNQGEQIKSFNKCKLRNVLLDLVNDDQFIDIIYHKIKDAFQ